MNELTIMQTSKFKKDLKSYQHDNKLLQELKIGVEMLQKRIPLCLLNIRTMPYPVTMTEKEIVIYVQITY